MFLNNIMQHGVYMAKSNTIPTFQSIEFCRQIDDYKVTNEVIESFKIFNFIANLGVLGHFSS